MSLREPFSVAQGRLWDIQILRPGSPPVACKARYALSKDRHLLNLGSYERYFQSERPAISVNQIGYKVTKRHYISDLLFVAIWCKDDLS